MTDTTADKPVKEEKSKHASVFVLVAGSLLLLILVVSLVSGFMGSQDREDEEALRAAEEAAAPRAQVKSQSFEEGFNNYAVRREAEEEAGYVETASGPTERPYSGRPSWEQEVLDKQRKRALEALLGDMQVDEDEEEAGVARMTATPSQAYVSPRTSDIQSDISALEAQLKQLEAN